MKTCDECTNYECDNFDGVGWCNLNKAMVLHDDPACKEFNELPDDGEKNRITMTLEEYQKQAMTTCMPTCNNFSYMLLNLVGEVGELASKVAKSIRKDEATIEAGDLRQPSTRHIDDDLNEAMQLEAGDILWQLAGLCSVMGWDLEQIAKTNLEKLASRQKRGVIDGNGDNR